MSLYSLQLIVVLIEMFVPFKSVKKRTKVTLLIIKDSDL